MLLERTATNMFNLFVGKGIVVTRKGYTTNKSCVLTSRKKIYESYVSNYKEPLFRNVAYIQSHIVHGYIAKRRKR